MKTTITMTIATLMLSATVSFAADTKILKSDRLKMADMHTRMAECLKSDKPMNDCQDEMMKSCKGMMGKQGCPMMGMGKDGMMNRYNEEKSSKE